jgi:hypothetical protein
MALLAALASTPARADVIPLPDGDELHLFGHVQFEDGRSDGFDLQTSRKTDFDEGVQESFAGKHGHAFTVARAKGSLGTMALGVGSSIVGTGGMQASATATAALRDKYIVRANVDGEAIADGTPLFLDFGAATVDGHLEIEGNEPPSDWFGSAGYNLTLSIDDTSFTYGDQIISQFGPRRKRLDGLDIRVISPDTQDGRWRIEAGKLFDVRINFSTFNGLLGGVPDPDTGVGLNGEASTYAEFMNTFYWGGIDSITLADGRAVDFMIESAAGSDLRNPSKRAAVPEPPALALLALGLAAIAAPRRVREPRA